MDSKKNKFVQEFKKDVKNVDPIKLFRTKEIINKINLLGAFWRLEVHDNKLPNRSKQYLGFLYDIVKNNIKIKFFYINSDGSKFEVKINKQDLNTKLIYMHDLIIEGQARQFIPVDKRGSLTFIKTEICNIKEITNSELEALIKTLI